MEIIRHRRNAYGKDPGGAAVFYTQCSAQKWNYTKIRCKVQKKSLE
jgi:hypothetical protein